MSESYNIISNIIAGLSLIVSLSLAIYYIKDRRHAQYHIVNEYAKDLLIWHKEVILVLLELESQTHNKQQHQVDPLLVKLSALIEQGRFFFPNINMQGNYGKDKPPAYRGFRNLALDFLVAAYNIFSGEISPIKLDTAKMLRRYFTSIVFELVQPIDRLKTIKQLTDRYFIKEESFESFLRQNDSSIFDSIWHNKSH